MTVETSATATTRFAPAQGPSMLLPATVACGVFMTSLDQNVVVTALPGIGESLDRPPSQLGLLITVYVASLIVTMPLGGCRCSQPAAGARSVRRRDGCHLCRGRRQPDRWRGSCGATR